MRREGGNHCSPTTVPLRSLTPDSVTCRRRLVELNVFFTSSAGDGDPGTGMAGAAAPKRQDTRKFFENLSGAGKSIAVLTSGGDAQGDV